MLLLQVGIWIPITRAFFTPDLSSPAAGSAPGSGDPSTGVTAAILIALFVVVVLCPPAGVACLAPKRPFLLGTLASFVPTLVAFAEYPAERKQPDSEYTLIANAAFTVAAMLLAALPIALLRRRIALIRHRSAEPPMPYTGVQDGSAADFDASWPPAPRL